MSILITGGAGYIGSHTLIALSEAGYDFVVYDNLSNSSKESIKRVEKIINKSISFEEGDIRDKEALKKVLMICVLMLGDGRVIIQMDILKLKGKNK
ncbi:SDR family NAD(P)-dependent oxidoreductase [Aliarcobacter butzleri]|uniref:SDR family NAD(P)-dependent oxidoreductase n=1 Tax=Aliarcobacter butzleri TaxID=28197 RepID=UPI0021B1C029|nr:SDR family NAD(P)-dependent oxidoreductase [Aliarcobacter butzleri]MCT7631144.1 SDR family NAD(P)-dependent oxidoreductase [Aliarcobacter butzleri]